MKNQVLTCENASPSPCLSHSQPVSLTPSHVHTPLARVSHPTSQAQPPKELNFCYKNIKLKGLKNSFEHARACTHTYEKKNVKT